MPLLMSYENFNIFHDTHGIFRLEVKVLLLFPYLTFEGITEANMYVHRWIVKPNAFQQQNVTIETR